MKNDMIEQYENEDDNLGEECNGLQYGQRVSFEAQFMLEWEVVTAPIECSHHCRANKHVDVFGEKKQSKLH